MTSPKKTIKHHFESLRNTLKIEGYTLFMDLYINIVILRSVNYGPQAKFGPQHVITWP